MMSNYIEAYRGIKKCVINDFPYELNWDDHLAEPIFEKCYELVMEDHRQIDNPYYSYENTGIIRLEYLDHYVILCYRYSSMLFHADLSLLADAVYYSLRIRGGIDLYYKTSIGRSFVPVHAIGTVMDSHSTYGDYFRIYNGCHIGPYSIIGCAPEEWDHPVFGDHVTLLGYSKVYGKTVVGSNVIISANTFVVNEDIPDNCIVSGSSPNLIFQRLRIKT